MKIGCINIVPRSFRMTTRIDICVGGLKLQRCAAKIARRRFLHLSPLGRGRIAQAIRVRGLCPQSNRKSSRSVPSIISSTPSRLSYTSVLETRTTWKPQASSTLDRASSRARSEGSACVMPSTSMISLPWSVTKSTTYRSIGCWRRNFQWASRRLRKACHSFASALVCDSRSFLALVLNLSIFSPGYFATDLSSVVRRIVRPTPSSVCGFPLTRLLRSRPLPNGERYSIANAAP
jgi:hypothetical protein